MKRERWQRISNLYFDALQQEPGARRQYIENACSGDPVLQRELESLLEADEKVGDFLASPALDDMARTVARHETQALKGQLFGHFQILSAFRSGGMGNLYVARDLKLGRKVALKFLPAYYTSDRERVERFEQEARAASALNHPNIVTVFEIDEIDNRHFIAMELVQGLTLRDRITVGRIDLPEALDITSQLASALAAAHEAGIIHRDIKPENIIIRPDGYVKVLDFGLAKLTEPLRPSPVDSAINTRLRITGEPGRIMGTPRYMSPEQLQGKTLDGRADIFCLGIVLYEILAGRPPFDGNTPSELIGAIQHVEATPLGGLAPVGPEVERIVNQALAKDRQERYQKAEDLSQDLKNLMAELELEARLKKTVPHPKSTFRRKMVLLALGLLVGAVGAMLGLNVGGIRDRLADGIGQKPMESLAVLPLENLSGDPDQEFFTDGMTEALIANLAQIRSLRVISRTSALRYKRTDKTVPQISQELNVDVLVEGSVTRSRDRVRISAQLIHGPTDTQLWALSYERHLSDVLTLQREVARAIAEEVRVRLSPEEESHLAPTRPVDPEVYALYLRGREQQYLFTQASRRLAIKFFEEAIKRDPTFGPAYSGLADCWMLIGSTETLPPHEPYQKAKAAVAKALELDKKLADAYVSLGFIRLNYDWDLPGTREAFLEALELNSGLPWAHVGYAYYLSAMRRGDEALPEMQQAAELDPLSSFFMSSVGLAYDWLGDFDSALEWHRRALETTPHDFNVRADVGMEYLWKGSYEDGIAAIQEALELSKGDHSYVNPAWLALAYAMAGQRPAAIEILEDWQTPYPDSDDVAAVHVALGNTEKAFAWLERAYELRSGDLIFLNVDRRFAPLRSDPRFGDLARRIGLPE